MGESRAPKADVSSKSDQEQEPIAAARDAVPKGPTLFDRAWRRKRPIGAAATLGILVVAVVVLRKKPHTDAPSPSAWRGRVATTLTGGSGGVLVVDPQSGESHVLAPGEAVPPGAHLRNDLRTWSRLRFDDGTTMVSDRGSEMALDAKRPRTAKLESGEVVLDVAPQKEAATVELPHAVVTTHGAKLAIQVDLTRAAIAVAHGTATVKAGANEATLVAGQSAMIVGDEITIQPETGLGGAFLLAERDEIELAPEGDSANVPGVAELRARLPGDASAGDRSLALVSEKVSIHVVGDIARTEIDAEFRSDDPKELEGIFRFGLPAEAQLDRLALEVDGKLQEGAFVEKEKGTAIWAGILWNAAPKQRLHEDTVFQRGPWSDPALLEWRAGGRMELRIFPIPPKSSRRVVLAYTQKVGKIAGHHRYVYPLPHLPDGRVAIDDFSLKVDVDGFDPSFGVGVKGYEATTTGGQGGARLEKSILRKAFVPTGDVLVDYALPASAATAHAFHADNGETFASLDLSPGLPPLADDRARTAVLVVDASRSMRGERFARASALAERIVEELDPRDRFVLLACDSSCIPFAPQPLVPSKEVALKAMQFLRDGRAEGATDLPRALADAIALARADGAARSLRLLYLGDGDETVGAMEPYALEAAVRDVMKTAGEGASLSAVALGVDADLPSLDALARGGGGTVLPYVAGEKIGAVALDALAATYGGVLVDPVLTLPVGFMSVAPARLRPLRIGETLHVVARTQGPVHGAASLSGTLAGKPWSTTMAIDVTPSSEASWVPRVFAAVAIADAERTLLTAASRREIVELSKVFGVPSRYTSLLVTESPAMAAAFGVTPRARVATWSDANSEVTKTTTAPTTTADGTEKPTPELAPAVSMIVLEGATPKVIADAPREDSPCAPRRTANDPEIIAKAGWGGVVHHWYCTPTFSTDARPMTSFEPAIDAAKNALAAAAGASDERAKSAALYALLAHREDTTDAEIFNGKVALRDAFDAAVIFHEADFFARRGERAQALRVGYGAIDARPDDVALADGLASVAERAGDERAACELRSLHAMALPVDVDAVARRVSCLRARGDGATASALLGALPPGFAPKIEAIVAQPPKKAATSLTGQLVVDATWTGGTDLDVALIDPNGARRSWLTPSGTVALDSLSTSHEALALVAAPAGLYTIEVTRASKADSAPVSGTLVVRVAGFPEQRYAFKLEGAKTTVASVDLAWKDSWLAPIRFFPPTIKHPRPYVDFADDF